MSTRQRRTIKEWNEVTQLVSELWMYTVWRSPKTGGCEYGNP